MNDRQRDLFLYQWSRRRTPGVNRVALRGAIIGGLGGFAFAWFLHRSGASKSGVHSYDIGGQLIATLELFAISVPTFAVMGLVLARRVFRTQESMFQAIVATGARVPDQKPELGMADRGPMLAVIITFVVLAGCIAWLIWAANTGRL